MTKSFRLPKVDLLRHNLEEVRFEIYFRADNQLLSSETGEELNSTRLTRYSRRKRGHMLFEELRQHVDDENRFQLIIGYDASEDVPEGRVPKEYSQETYAQSALRLLTKMEMIQADYDFKFPLESLTSRKLLAAIPALTDAKSLYLLAPANPPLDRITRIEGIKYVGNSPQDGGFRIGLMPPNDDYLQIHIGFSFEEDSFEPEMVLGWIEYGEGLLKRAL